MQPTRQLVCLGTDHPEKGTHWLERLAPDLVAATTAGEGASLNPKRVPNEDSLAVVVHAGDAVSALVADSHFGARAGELVAAGFAARAADAPPLDARALTAVLIALDADLHAERAGHTAPGALIEHPLDPSATTALCATLVGTTIHWASFGDSLLVVVPRTGYPRQLAATQMTFLGDRPLPADITPDGAAEWIDSGHAALAPGDVVLLASDGLEPRCSGLTLDEVGDVLRGVGPLEQRVAALMERAGRSPGGGRDNLTVVAVLVGAQF